MFLCKEIMQATSKDPPMETESAKSAKGIVFYFFLFKVFPNIENSSRGIYDPFPEKVVQNLCLEMDFRKNPQILEQAPRNDDFLWF